jgi:hypothetical protein
MRLSFLGIFDPAGAGYSYAQAISKHTPHEARAFFQHATLPAPDNDGTLGSDDERVWTDAADIVLLHLGDGIYQNNPRLAEALPKVTHYWNDGGPYRDARKTWWESCNGRPMLATMWMIAKEYEATWVPCCVREYVDERSMTWQPEGHPQWPWLMHMATNPGVKNTADLVAVLDEMRKEKSKTLPRYRYVYGKCHRDAMSDLAASDIYFDNMQGYPGVASYEASALGLPVINHFPDEGWRELEAWGCEEPPPWYEAASRDELKALLRGWGVRESAEDRIGWYDRNFHNGLKALRLVRILEGM